MAYKSIDLMKAGPPGQPLDLQAQQAALAQQAAIANALIAQSMERSSPIIHTGGGNQFARDIPNFGDPIAKVVQAMQGRKKLEEATRGQAELNAEQERRSRAEIGAITDARLGRSAPGGTGTDDFGNEMPGVQTQRPSFPEAVRRAVQATTPAGKAMLAELLKSIPSPEKFLEHGQKYSGPSLGKYETTLDPSVLESRPTTTVHDNVAVTAGEKGVVGTKPVQQFALDTSAIPGLPIERSLDTGAIKGIAGGSTTPPQKLIEKLDEETVKALSEGRKAYVEDSNRLATIGQIKTDLSALPAEKFGVLADTRNTLNKLTELLGAKPMDATANLESVKTSTGKLMLEKIRLLAPVDAQDRKIIQEIVGTEGMTKRGLEKIMDQLEKATVREMARHEKLINDVRLPEGYNRDLLRNIFQPEFSTQATPPVQTPAAPAGGWKIEPL